MNNYYKIKVFYFNKYDIYSIDRLSMSTHDSEEIIVEKVENGYREIVTNVFIPEKSIIDISKSDNGCNKFFKFYYTKKEIIKEIEENGYILGTDIEYYTPQLIKKMYEIKEYLDIFDLNKFTRMLHGIQLIKCNKQKNNINDLVTKENVKRLVKEYKYGSEE